MIKNYLMKRFVLTRFDSRRKMSWDIDRKLRERFGAEMCETRISENVSLAEPGPELRVFQHAPEKPRRQRHAALLDELPQAGFVN